MSRELGDGALFVFYVGPSCLTPPRPQRGLRAKKLKSMVLKGAEKVKKFGARRILDTGCWKTSDQLTVIGYQENHRIKQEEGPPGAPSAYAYAIKLRRDTMARQGRPQLNRFSIQRGKQEKGPILDAGYWMLEAGIVRCPHKLTTGPP